MLQWTPITQYSQVGHNFWGSELVTRWELNLREHLANIDDRRTGSIPVEKVEALFSCNEQCAPDHHWEMKVWASSEMSDIDFVFCPAVRDTPPIGCDWHYKTHGGCFFKRGFKSVCLWFELSSIVTYSQATSFMEENPVPSIDHYRDINNRHLGLPSPRVRRSFGSTNPIILKLSSLAGPYAPLVLKAAKIFCKITGPGIFCWKYSEYK